MSKTFKWTIPEIGLSRAEKDDHHTYKAASRGIHSNEPKPLSKSELKFLEAWSQTRQRGRKAYYQKLLLRACLAISIFTGLFLLAKEIGLIHEGTTIYTTGTMLAIGINVAPSLNAWKNNEKRYHELLARLEAIKS